MVKSVENGVSVAPFLVKCYEMVDDASTDDLISWNPSNSSSFVIWDDSKFSSQMLPKYFKHNNLSSFVRQLNIYGFRKIDTDRYEFANDGFVKGQKHLLKNIIRRKHPQVQKKSTKDEDAESCTPEDDKRTALRKEVEILKTDRNALMQELIKLRQHQKTSQSKMILVREQMKGMEKNQQQMLSFIVMAMQSHGFLAQLLQPKENTWRMAESGKNILTPAKDNCKPELADGAIVRYQPSISETVDPCTPPPLSSDNSMEWDLSPDELRDLLANIDFTPGPWDDNLLSLENHGQLVLPDMPENDCIMEQLLLSSPISEKEDFRHDSEAGNDTEMLSDSMFQPQVSEKLDIVGEESGDHQNKIKEQPVGSESPELSQSMEFLAEQLELLNPKRNT